MKAASLIRASCGLADVDGRLPPVPHPIHEKERGRQQVVDGESRFDGLAGPAPGTAACSVQLDNARIGILVKRLHRVSVLPEEGFKLRCRAVAAADPYDVRRKSL